MRIILASKSPRRREILDMLGVDFDIITAQTNETSSQVDPPSVARELALVKGQAVLEQIRPHMTDGTIIISADTIVVAPDGKTIYGKPRGKSDAKTILRALSGTRHAVISALAVISQSRQVTAHECSYVTFGDMSDDDINFYISSNEPYDKAGAYAVQGLAALFIEKIEGDYFNIVGLPVRLLGQVLQKDFGIDPKQIFNAKERASWDL